MTLKPYVGRPFESVGMVMQHLNTFPERWTQYDVILECFETGEAYCKIYMGNNPWKYMMANQDEILMPTFKQRWKIWRIIRKKKALMKTGKWDLK